MLKKTIFKKFTHMFSKPNVRDISEWFVVKWDDIGVTLHVDPPTRKPWTAYFKWSDIQKICLKMKDMTCSDGIYVFTSLRPESWVIPVDAEGGLDFLKELIERKLFDGELAIKAAQAKEGLFCWPPPNKSEVE